MVVVGEEKEVHFFFLLFSVFRFCAFAFLLLRRFLILHSSFFFFFFSNGTVNIDKHHSGGEDKNGEPAVPPSPSTNGTQLEEEER